MRAVTPDEVRRMLAQVDLKAPLGPRDYLLVVFAYHTGLRVSELAGLSVHDVAHQGVPRAEVHVSAATAKGGRSRQVPLNAVARKAVAKLLSFNQARGFSVAPEAPLFVNRRHEPMPVRTMQFVVARLREKAGLDFQTTPHSLRHAFATNLTQCSSNLRVVQCALGHRRLNTVQVYTHVRPDEVVTAVERLVHQA